MPNRWRSHQYVAIVVRMMPRSKNSENLTNTTEPKPTSWKGGMIRRRKPSNRSIDRVPKLQGTQISRKICVSIIVLVKRGATIAHLKIKERTPLPSHKVMFKKKEGRYRNVLVSFSAWYSEKPIRVVTVRKLRWTDPVWGAFRSSCGACVRWMTSIINGCYRKGGDATDGMYFVQNLLGLVARGDEPSMWGSSVALVIVVVVAVEGVRNYLCAKPERR